MTKLTQQQLDEQPQYVLGYVEGLSAIVLELVSELTEREDFRPTALEKIQGLRDTLGATPVPEARLRGVEACKTWFEHVTE